MELPDVDWRSFPRVKLDHLKDVSHVDTKENGFSFSVKPTTTATPSLHRDEYPMALAAHQGLRRRQESSASSATISSIVPSNLTSVPYQAPSPHNTTANKTTTSNLSFALIDHEFTVLEQLTRPKIPLSLVCKNCSTTGELIVRRGEFNLTNITELAEEILNENDPVRIFDTGFVEMQVNGFSAHVELQNALSKSFPHSTTLFQQPLFGLEVPGVGILGVFFQVPLAISLGLSGGLEFTYGFDVNVPNNSTIRIDFANMNHSATTGFENALITPLPFQANLTAVELTARVALTPAVVVGFAFDKKALGQTLDATAKAGVFLDLPALEANFKTLAVVDEKCNAATNLTASHQSILDQMGNLTHITPTVEVDLGVQAQFAFAVDKHSRALNFPKTLLNKTKTMPTACLAYDKSAKTFAPASVLYTSMSLAAASSSSASAASAASPKATHKGAAGSLKPPSALFTSADQTILVGMVVGSMTAFGVFSVL